MLRNTDFRNTGHGILRNIFFFSSELPGNCPGKA